MANTVSNLFTVALGLHGAYTIWTQKLPHRYLSGFLVRLYHFCVYLC